MHAIDESIRRLAARDLNLLVALHALLEEASVTRAARRLGRTQSSTSHALQRLREDLGDPLLVRSGRGLAPTPRARALAAPVAEAVAAVERVFEAPGPFDPSTSSRRFRIACPDLAAPLVPGLLARLTASAPQLAVEIVQPGPGWIAALADGGLDLALAPAHAGDGADLRRVTIGAVHFAVAARRGHPAGRDGLSVAGWTGWPHVVVRTGDEGPNLLQRQLDAAGVTRRIGLVAPSFLLALHVVSHTNLLLAAPAELVRDLAGPLGLDVYPLPIEAPPLPVALLWHERTHHDAGHAWLRERVRAEVAARVGGKDGAPHRSLGSAHSSPEGASLS